MRTQIQIDKEIEEHKLISKIAEILHENFDEAYKEYFESRYNGIYITSNQIPDSIMDKALESLRELVEEEVKDIKRTFGGCEICYGKGYATTKSRMQSFEDFGGENTFDKEVNEIRPCSCDRGKQILSIINQHK